MQSKNVLADVDFERDLPTTPEDIAALARAREANHLDPHTYLEFLLTTTANVPASRDVCEWPEPFTL